MSARYCRPVSAAEPGREHEYEETGSSSWVGGKLFDHVQCRYCRHILLVDVETGAVARDGDLVPEGK